MKKSLKALIITALSLFLIWLSVLGIDLARCRQLKDPIFAVCPATADDGGSGVYSGLGYTIEIERHIDAECGVKTDYVEMRLFDLLVYAVIID